MTVEMPIVATTEDVISVDVPGVGAAVAMVAGQPLLSLPKSLYIPPHALRVLLSSFEGPLDLLLYLIKRQDFNILEIPVNLIANQYIAYINLMDELDIDLAAEYLLMASMLIEIKSMMLLPRPMVSAEDDDEDPRMALIKRLQEYEIFKRAAVFFEEHPRVGRDLILAGAALPAYRVPVVPIQIELKDILSAMQAVVRRSDRIAQHELQFDVLTIDDRIDSIKQRLVSQEFTNLNKFYQRSEGSMGVAVTLIAILELARCGRLEIDQSGSYEPIYIRSVEVREAEDVG
jgi:segregation and condensation protein A